MESKYNTRSPAVKRLMKEAAEMSVATADYQAAPLDENLFEWHFTVRGPGDTDFQGGVYHGRIIVPADYPMKPPDIIVLTPNGRFEVGKKICLSISGHHPETWQPSWSIRTALLAIIGFMPSPAHGTIGSLDYTPDERQALARRSLTWTCPTCGNTSSLLAPPGVEEVPGQAQEVKEIVKSLQIKSEEEMAGESKDDKEIKKDESPEKPIPSSSVPSSQIVPPSDSSSSSSSSNTSRTTTKAGASNFAIPTVPPTTRPHRSRIQAAAEMQQSQGIQQVYDFCIMLLVAAIAALLYRRIGIMQTPGDSPGLGDHE